MKRIFIILLALVFVAPTFGSRFRWMTSGRSGSVVSVGSYDPSTDAKVVEWLKADTLAQSDGTDVASWTAATGNAAAQASSTNRPVFHTAQKNGLPAITFDVGAGSTRQYLTTTTFGTLTQPYTVWVVFRFTDITNYRFVFDGLTASNRAVFLRDNTAGAYDMNAGSDSTTGLTDTLWHIAECYYNGASSTLTIDNGTPTTLSPGANSFVGMTIGTDYSVSFNPAMQVGEIIVQNAAPTSASAIFAYLDARWAVY